MCGSCALAPADTQALSLDPVTVTSVAKVGLCRRDRGPDPGMGRGFGDLGWPRMYPGGSRLEGGGGGVTQKRRLRDYGS